MNIIVRGYNLSDDQIINFFSKHIDWVNKKLKKQLSKTTKLETDKINSGDVIWLFGNKLKVIIDENTHIYKLNKNILYVSNKIDFKIIINYLKEDYRYIIDKMIDKYKIIFNINPVVAYKDMYSKYGYCEYMHNKIVFSKRLIHISLEAIEYVVVHEFCHFIVPNHSKDFYDLVGKYLPDYKKQIKWIKEHSMIIRY